MATVRIACNTPYGFILNIGSAASPNLVTINGYLASQGPVNAGMKGQLGFTDLEDWRWDMVSNLWTNGGPDLRSAMFKVGA